MGDDSFVIDGGISTRIEWLGKCLCGRAITFKASSGVGTKKEVGKAAREPTQKEKEAIGEVIVVEFVLDF